MTDSDTDTVARSYVQAWNETDPARRRALLQDGWTADAVYVDPLASARGHDAIGELIGGVQARFAGFRFALVGRKPDGHGDFVRFGWSLGPPGADPAPIEGSDVVELRDGRIARVIGFLDRVPAG